MDKFRIAYSIIIKVWRVISEHKDKDVTQDKECKQLLDDLQVVCNEFTERFGDAEGKLTRNIAGLFMEYLCGKED